MKIVNSNYDKGYSEASNEAFKEIRKNYIPGCHAIRHQSK